MELDQRVIRLFEASDKARKIGGFGPGKITLEPGPNSFLFHAGWTLSNLSLDDLKIIAFEAARCLGQSYLYIHDIFGSGAVAKGFVARPQFDQNEHYHPWNATTRVDYWRNSQIAIGYATHDQNIFRIFPQEGVSVRVVSREIVDGRSRPATPEGHQGGKIAWYRSDVCVEPGELETDRVDMLPKSIHTLFRLDRG